LRGVATARAAISIVNALPLGIGAAVGIEWPAHATARFDDDRPYTSRALVEPPASSTVIVHAAARAARQRFSGPKPGRLRLVVRSTIPVARGLKSSTAVGSAVALATARACGREPAPSEIARIVAEVGRTTGVSATGAFDDALAGLTPGGVVTDNRRDRELRRFTFEPDVAVALWVPDRTHPRSPRVRARFRGQPQLAHRAVDAALDGDWAGAMEANSTLVETAMGYRYAALRERLRGAGATACGVSGLGPTFAVLAPRRRLPKILRALPREGRRRSVRFFSGSSSFTGGR
jgi:shikimate kinase